MSSFITENIEKDYDFSEMIIISWNFISKHYTNIFSFTFFLYLIKNIILINIPEFNLNLVFNMPTIESIYMVFYFVITFFITAFFNIPVILYIISLLYELNVSTFEILKQFITLIFTRFFSNILTILLFLGIISSWAYLAVRTPLIFLISALPIIVLLIYFSFSLYAMALKKIDLWSSLKYSYSVVNGKWLKVFIFLIIIYLLSAVTAMALGIPYTILSGNIYTEILFNTLINVVCTYFVVLNTFVFINFDNIFQSEIRDGGGL